MRWEVKGVNREGIDVTVPVQAIDRAEAEAIATKGGIQVTEARAAPPRADPVPVLTYPPEPPARPPRSEVAIGLAYLVRGFFNFVRIVLLAALVIASLAWGGILAGLLCAVLIVLVLILMQLRRRR